MKRFRIEITANQSCKWKGSGLRCDTWFPSITFNKLIAVTFLLEKYWKPFQSRVPGAGRVLRCTPHSWYPHTGCHCLPSSSPHYGYLGWEINWPILTCSSIPPNFVFFPLKLLATSKHTHVRSTFDTGGIFISVSVFAYARCVLLTQWSHRFQNIA